MEIKVINVNFCDLPITYISRKKRAKYLASYLTIERPDILLLQEVYTKSTKNLFLSALGGNYFSTPNYNLINFSGGLLAFVNKNKFNVLSTVFKKFINTGPLKYLEIIPDRLIQKGYQILYLETFDNKKLAVINTHLFMNYRNNNTSNKIMRDQLIQLTNDINELRIYYEYVICSGDFNIEPQNTLICNFRHETKLNDLFCNDTRPTITTSNINRKWYGKHRTDEFRCDYIFHSKNIVTSKSDIIFDKPGIFEGNPIQASDHYGLECTINV